VTAAKISLTERNNILPLCHLFADKMPVPGVFSGGKSRCESVDSQKF